ncbi:MAG: hypothetical protein ABIR06_22570 [Cyclobacteriaceae bacterium]
MTRTKGDSSACKMMCATMMEHKKVMSAMLSGLEEKGAIKKGCMAESKTELNKDKKKPAHH